MQRASSNFNLPHNLPGSDRDFHDRGYRDPSFRTEFGSSDRGAGGEDAAVRVATGSSGQASCLPPNSLRVQRAKARRGPLDSSDIYDNGPINGNTDAWTINFGFIVSDSFTIANDQTPITGMSFGAWLFSGDTLTSVELSITSGENSGTSYFDQTVTFTQGSCTSNQYGYNVCAETTSFNGPTLNAGTYWVNLQNASVPSGDPVYWDENSGVGCQGSGCPSQASENGVGSIPSEAFTILGGATTTSTTPCSIGSQQRLYELRDLGQFTGSNYPSGVAIDRKGNVYGTPGQPDVARRAVTGLGSGVADFDHC